MSTFAPSPRSCAVLSNCMVLSPFVKSLLRGSCQHNICYMLCDLSTMGQLTIWFCPINHRLWTYWYHTSSGHFGADAYDAIRGPLIVHPEGNEGGELANILDNISQLPSGYSPIDQHCYSFRMDFCHLLHLDILNKWDASSCHRLRVTMGWLSLPRLGSLELAMANYGMLYTSPRTKSIWFESSMGVNTTPFGFQ